MLNDEQIGLIDEYLAGELTEGRFAKLLGVDRLDARSMVEERKALSGVKDNWQLDFNLSIGADEPAEIIILLREVIKRLKKGHTEGEETYCAGVYRFEVLPRDDDLSNWHNNPELVRDILLLVCIDIPLETINEWSVDQRKQAEDWAVAEYLSASDNFGVEVPPKPAFL